MSKEKTICSNELTIRFDQYEDNKVSWSVIPDARGCDHQLAKRGRSD
jgi:hypothetical protein